MCVGVSDIMRRLEPFPLAVVRNDVALAPRNRRTIVCNCLVKGLALVS